MFCEKCGSNNHVGATNCSKCGEKMPETEGGNGFMDILSYEVPNGNVRNNADDKSVQKLEKKINNLIQAEKRLFILSFASIALSVILLISLVVVGLNNSATLEEHSDNIHMLDNKVDDLSKKNEKNNETDEEKNSLDMKKIEEGIKDIGNSLGSKANGN